MGWAFCGQDDLGRRIGYAIEATCDFEGCKARIDRGLGHCCGSMHRGDDDNGCGRYFCEEHQFEGENGHECKVREDWLEREENDPATPRWTPPTTEGQDDG